MIFKVLYHPNPRKAQAKIWAGCVSSSEVVFGVMGQALNHRPVTTKINVTIAKKLSDGYVELGDVDVTDRTELDQISQCMLLIASHRGPDALPVPANPYVVLESFRMTAKHRCRIEREAPAATTSTASRSRRAFEGPIVDDVSGSWF